MAGIGFLPTAVTVTQGDLSDATFYPLILRSPAIPKSAKWEGRDESPQGYSEGLPWILGKQAQCGLALRSISTIHKKGKTMGTSLIPLIFLRCHALRGHSETTLLAVQ